MKKVLIISYYWPPSGGMCIIRPLKLAKYLRKTGWEPVICTAKDPHYPFEDQKGFLDVPDDMKIIKIPIKEPYGIYKAIMGEKDKSVLADVIHNPTKTSFIHKISVWIRGNFFIPDARSLWINPVLKELTAFLRENPVDAIITTGPPHSVNRIGYLLKKKFNLPWIADFQDPWTQVDYYDHFKISSWAHKRHRMMENQVFDNADLVTIVSESWKRDLKSIGAKDVEVIPLGFDPQDFNAKIDLDIEFTITHLGLLGKDRQPFTFLKAIKEICDENESFASRVRLQLVGNVNDALKNEIIELGLSSQVIYKGQVDRSKALEIMQSSHLLLLLLNKAPNVSGRIPGKFFEYLGSKRPILSLGPLFGTDLEKMLKKSSSGVYYDYDDLNMLKKYLNLQFDLFCSSGIKINKNHLQEEYSHRRIADTFGSYLDKIIEKGKVK